MNSKVNLNLATVFRGSFRALPVIAMLSTSSMALATEQQTHVEEFKGIRSLRTVNLCANVEIQTQPEATDAAFLTISVDKDLENCLKTLKIRNEDGCLSLVDESGQSGGAQVFTDGYGNISVSGSGSYVSVGNMTVNGRRIIVDGVDVTKAAQTQTHSLPTIRLVLSQNIPMKLDANAGSWVVGDTRGTFTALLKGSCRMVAAHIFGDTDVDIKGSGEFQAASIMADEFESSISGPGKLRIGEAQLKNAKAHISGSGDVRFNAGTIANKLAASISGSGDISVDCTAKDAKLKVSGSGDIRVKEVTGELDRTTSGSGKIKVGNRR